MFDRSGATFTRNTEYGSVRLWIAKDRGALIKAEGYNWQGKAIKRFEVISGQQIEGKTIFKQIRIERLDPQNGKVVSRTYLELDSTVVKEVPVPVSVSVAGRWSGAAALRRGSSGC